MSMKIAYAITRILRGTDKIDGLVVIVTNRTDADKYAANLNEMKLGSFTYGVLEAAYYEGDINEAIPAP